MQLLCTSSLLLTSSCTLRRVRKFYTVLSLPMSFLVAPHTKRYWILDHVMDGAASQSLTARQLKDEAEAALANGDLPEAHVKLEALRRMLDGDTGELVRLESSLYALEALARDTDEGENA